MNKFFITLAAVVGIGWGVTAFSHEVEPAHYHVGKTQPFQGLVCRSQESAMHIFNTWIEKNIDAAKLVFQVYASGDECKYLVGYDAYFIEKIIGSRADNFDGELDKVIVFAISPNEESEVVDYLLTWENIGAPV